MEHYLEYLSKLQKEMKLDEKVDYDKLEEYQKLRSKYDNLASLFGFICITVALSMVFVAHYSRIGAMVVMLLVFGVMNVIINDGDEHLQQLVTWCRMCELTASDKEKYAELLRIVHDVCREYALIWR